MTKFVGFRERKYDNKTGWNLYDIAINVDSVSMIKQTNNEHTFENYDVEKAVTLYKKSPVTVLVLHDGMHLSVLGSYEHIYLKISGE